MLPANLSTSLSTVHCSTTTLSPTKCSSYRSILICSWLRPRFHRAYWTSPTLSSWPIVFRNWRRGAVHGIVVGGGFLPPDVASCRPESTSRRRWWLTLLLRWRAWRWVEALVLRLERSLKIWCVRVRRVNEAVRLGLGISEWVVGGGCFRGR